MTGRRVVLSYGMGADSTALVLRWIHEPATRPCDLAGLLLITAMTGDEWPITGRLVTDHLLPRFRRHGIRWVQVARAGASQADGIAVLSDSRQTARVHLGGAYKLSQEMLAAGTIPQVTGKRKCSLKAKAWVIEKFLAAEMGGRPYLHVMGYETGEADRARRDTRYNTAQRTGMYPLIIWGWGRKTCEEYIFRLTGVKWPKSACAYCGYALCSKDGRARTLARFEDDPATGVQALVMEHIAVALNPRQGLAAGERLYDLLARTGRHRDVLAAFAIELNRLPWRVYEVRRALRPRTDDPAMMGNTVRSLRHLTEGTRTTAPTALRQLAAHHGADLDNNDGICRAWLRRRGQTFPTAEHFLVAAPITPDGPEDKDGPGFPAAWAAATGGHCPPLTSQKTT